MRKKPSLQSQESAIQTIVNNTKYMQKILKLTWSEIDLLREQLEDAQATIRELRLSQEAKNGH
jgi:hypothetical protein